MDPTETFIQLVQTLEEFEEEYKIDPKSEATEVARTESIGLLKALQEWLGPLEGHPPEISEIDFELDDEDEDEDE